MSLPNITHSNLQLLEFSRTELVWTLPQDSLPFVCSDGNSKRFYASCIHIPIPQYPCILVSSEKWSTFQLLLRSWWVLEGVPNLTMTRFQPDWYFYSWSSTTHSLTGTSYCSARLYWSVFHFLQLLVPPPLITVPTNDLTWWSSDAAARSHQCPLSIHLVSEHTRIEKARSLHLYHPHPLHLKIDEWTNAASSKCHLSFTPATFKSNN